MKKRELKKKLSLNKETIANLEMKEIKGGVMFSAGCTDGCGPLKTEWNCTEADCTADCGTLVCNTGLTCTMYT